MNQVPYLEFCGISKEFPGVKALQNVSFSCQQGSVHALMGENGAGKSTLLKILSGFQAPTTGVVKLAGQERVFQSTVDALESGIAIIYQELHLVPEMTVAENIYLGQLPTRRGVIDREKLYQDAARQLARLGMDVSPETPLKYLSLGQWQMVEIAKALTRDASVIAFDEPTSSLSSREIEQLFRVIRQLRDEGKVILYVSHRMDEIFALCDAITVFKDGQFVRTFASMAEVDRDLLVKTMVGRDLTDIYGYSPRALGEVGLKVENLMGPGLKAPVSFEVKRGEILGIAGVTFGLAATAADMSLAGAVPAAFEQVVSHALGGLLAHAGQHAQRFDQLVKQGCGHHSARIEPGHARLLEREEVRKRRHGAGRITQPMTARMSSSRSTLYSTPSAL